MTEQRLTLEDVTFRRVRPEDDDELWTFIQECFMPEEPMNMSLEILKGNSFLDR